MLAQKQEGWMCAAAPRALQPLAIRLFGAPAARGVGNNERMLLYFISEVCPGWIELPGDMVAAAGGHRTCFPLVCTAQEGWHTRFIRDALLGTGLQVHQASGVFIRKL